MKIRAHCAALLLQEDLNFLLTNRVPRIALTRCMGWFSQIRSPLADPRCRSRVWRLFTDLDLSDATRAALHAACTTASRASCVAGARPIDPDPAVLASPCDAHRRRLRRGARTAQVFQAKGFPYALQRAVRPDARTRRPFRDGVYVTLRLTSACTTASTRRTTARSST